MMALLFSLAVHAAPLVSTDPDHASWVQEAMETPLTAVTLEQALSGAAPALRGEGGLLSCTEEKPAALEEIRALLDQVELDIVENELLSAWHRLDRAQTRLACAAEPVDTALLARVYLLRGRIGAWQGVPELAEADLATMLSLGGDPALVPADEAPVLLALDAARTRPRLPEDRALKLVPGDATLRLDGAPVEARRGVVTLSAGPHLLQIGETPVRTYMLELNTANARLVVPELVPPDALGRGWKGTESRAEIAEVLRVRFPREPVILLQDHRRVYEIGTEHADLRRVPARPPGRGLVRVGVGLIAAGAVAATATGVPAWLCIVEDRSDLTCRRLGVASWSAAVLWPAGGLSMWFGRRRYRARTSPIVTED